MELANKAVKGGMSITIASSTFAVPRETLDDRSKGNPGPCTALDLLLHCVLLWTFSFAHVFWSFSFSRIF